MPGAARIVVRLPSEGVPKEQSCAFSAPDGVFEVDSPGAFSALDKVFEVDKLCLFFLYFDTVSDHRFGKNSFYNSYIVFCK